MEPVDQVVAASLVAGLEAVEIGVFGTADPVAIARLVERYCESHLGTRPAGARFYASSVGCVLGLRLESGADVVVKAYQPRWRAPFLAAVQGVQRQLSARRFPCPEPLLAPAHISADLDALAVVETWLPDPGVRAFTSARALRVSASGLARQIALCDGLGRPDALRDHPLRKPESQLYGEPHSPLFDFEASSRGAEWIDELALRAVAVRDDDVSHLVISHTDWSARNVRLDERRVLAVYDWDSTALVEESTAVGQAAVTWRVTAEPGGADYPAADEVADFVRGYEEAAGRALSERQWRATGAAAAYTLAYAARCEHALIASGVRRPSPPPAAHRLAEAAEELLARRAEAWGAPGWTEASRVHCGPQVSVRPPSTASTCPVM